MKWFFIALAAPFLWAIVNIADNYLVSNFSVKEKERSSGGLVLFSSLIGIFIAFIIKFFVPNVFDISNLDKILLMFSGTLTILWVVFYLFALEIEDTSAVVPWFLAVPVFGYILGYLFLGETLTVNQYIGSAIIFIGFFFISFDFSGEKRRLKKKLLFYMLSASLIIAIAGIIFKYVTVENNFWVSSFWEYFGLGTTGFLIYLFIPKYRNEFKYMNKTGGWKIFIVNIGSELMTISGNLLTNFALLLAPVAMVYIVQSFQPALVLLVTILGTKFLPHIIKEDMSKKVLIPKIVAISLMILGSIVLFL
jgi:drug/metabolite transporter (DMT)-like permease